MVRRLPSTAPSVSRPNSSVATTSRDSAATSTPAAARRTATTRMSGRVSTPSASASAISWSWASAVSRSDGMSTTTRAAPRRSAERAASIATLSPPITTTLGGALVRRPKLTSRRKAAAYSTSWPTFSSGEAVLGRSRGRGFVCPTARRTASYSPMSSSIDSTRVPVRTSTLVAQMRPISRSRRSRGTLYSGSPTASMPPSFGIASKSVTWWPRRLAR